MTDYLHRYQKINRELESKASFHLKETSDSAPAKRVIALDEKAASKKQKTDLIDNGICLSGIDSLPSNSTLSNVLIALFPDDKKTTDAIESEAKENFKTGLPYIIGERQTQEGGFIYDKSNEMAKPYIQLRNHEKWPNGGFKAPDIEKRIFENDRFFLFASTNDPIVSLGRARDMEKKGIGLLDINHMLRLSEYDEASEQHYISMTRLTFSFLLGKNLIADSKGIDTSKFSCMLSDKEKTERSSDLMASAACDDGSPLFFLLLQDGVDPFRKSSLFDKSPAEMATREEARKNLDLIDKFKLGNKPSD